jgi:hypothetical protein
MKKLLLIVLSFVTLGLHAAPPSNIDLEISRVKKEVRQIQAMPISKDKKLEKLQTLREREMARSHLSAIKDAIKKVLDQASESFKAGQALGRD